MLQRALALLCALSSAGFAQAQRRGLSNASAKPAKAEKCSKVKTLKGADAEFAGATCPSLEPQFALAQTAGYNPNDVDWRSLVKAVEYLADQEARYCNFAIRVHFHDSGSLGKDAPAPATVYGSDGSMMLDKFEFLQPENAYDAFAFFARTVHTELARFYGASFADILNVAAFTCVRKLGADVAIPEACDAAGIPLYVGKLDADFSFSKDAARARTNNLPGNFEETPIWLNFWLVILNNQAESAKWQFETSDALALMGSHTLMDNQACTTDGAPAKNAPKDPKDKGCGGNQRMFKWTNSYFHDVTSGKCEPRAVSPANAEWFPTSDVNAKGRAPNDKEAATLADCTWQSKQGKDFGQNLECVVHRGAAELGIGEIPEDNDFRFVDWYPDQSRYPCCGYHCQTCPGNDVQDPYYCPNSPKDTSFWFYTWQDCDLIYASRTDVSKYCSGPKDCARYEPGPTDLGAQLKLMGGLYQQFRKDTGAWQTEYAYGHCKLNNMGAIYSENKTELLPLLDVCKGTMTNGQCSTDPIKGKVTKAGSCVGSDKPFNLSQVISKKTCKDCSDAVRRPIKLPKTGELKVGEKIVKGANELITEVAPIE